MIMIIMMIMIVIMIVILFMYFALTDKVEKAVDPVHEHCDIGVKVADLGNACWTVSCLRSLCVLIVSIVIIF